MKYHPLKQFVCMALLSVLPIAFFVACSTSQQQITYKTIYSLEQTATTAYDGYTSLVIKGALPTNDVPKISKAFNDFQAAAALSTTLAQNNTNALAPASLIQESTDLVNLITTIEGKK